MRELGRERFRLELAVAALKKAGCAVDKFPTEYVNAAVATCEGKIKRFGELAAYAGFYFSEQAEIDPAPAA